MRARGPASFWRENVNAVVILLQVQFSDNEVVEEKGYQMFEVLSICDRDGALPLLLKWPCNFSGEKKYTTYNEPFRGVFLFRRREKTLR